MIVVSAPVFPRDSLDEAPVRHRGPTFVYPAVTIRTRTTSVIEAFASVAATDPDVRLVLTGPGERRAEVDATIGRLDLSDRVDRMGMVTVARLDGCSGAVALVYPSRFEGYGLPLTEAMAVGCPVIASYATALPEVVGDAGVVVDPDDVAGWTDSMLRLLDDDAFRSTLIEAGRERVRAFTPRETARRQVDAYRLALGSEPADRSSAEHVDPD